MIKEIDALLRLWAHELHSDLSSGGLAGGNMVAMMMESNGQLSRGRRASKAPLEGSLDIMTLYGWNQAGLDGWHWY